MSSDSPPTQPNQDPADFNQVIESTFDEKKWKIIIENVKTQDEMRSKGFGEKEDNMYQLRPYEALYLLHTKKMTLKGKKNEYSFNKLVTTLLKRDKQTLTKFLIFRDLRTRGYVAREGFGFGVDFRVYERGEFEKKPAKYVVFAINEGTRMKMSSLSEAISQIEKMGKEPVIAVIERRGEIIYYKASQLRFIENKSKAKMAL